MKQPKKIYFSNDLLGNMNNIFSGKRFNSDDSKYISVEYLKEWINDQADKIHLKEWINDQADKRQSDLGSIYTLSQLEKFINEP